VAFLSSNLPIARTARVFYWKVRQWRNAELALASRLSFSTASLNETARSAAVAREATGEVEARSDTPPEATSETNASPKYVVAAATVCHQTTRCLAPGEAVRLLLLHKRGTESYLSAVRGQPDHGFGTQF
jgi:hypothetical protein